MNKLETSITNHNKAAELFNKVLESFYKEVEAYKGKKLFKIDGTPVKRLHDKLIAINKSLPQHENVRLAHSYGNVDIKIRTSYKAGNNWEYVDASFRIGEVNDIMDLTNLKELSELKQSDQLKDKSLEDNQNSYKQTKAYFDEVKEKWDSLSYEEREQLRQDFWFLR